MPPDISLLDHIQLLLARRQLLVGALLRCSWLLHQYIAFRQHVANTDHRQRRQAAAAHHLFSRLLDRPEHNYDRWARFSALNLSLRLCLTE